MKKKGDEHIELGFWQKAKRDADREKRPILTLAPMADVTDAAFRRIIAKYSRMGNPPAGGGGGPDVMWTEFVSADGLCSPGRKILLNDLTYTEGERPIVTQLFSSNPAKMREAAELVARLGFDGLDINMGCPDRSIEKQRAGAAMMKDPENAIAVLMAARDGVLDAVRDTELSPALRNSLVKSYLVSGPVCGIPASPSSRTISTRSDNSRFVKSSASLAAGIPVSVKTRIGYNKVEIDMWIRGLLEQKLPVLTVHLRTRKEMSDVPAHWELMPEIIRLRDEISPETLIIGNGDVTSIADAKEKAERSGCDGVMIGRAIFGNPWLFDNKVSPPVGGQKSIKLKVGKKGKENETEMRAIEEKLRVMVEHTELFMELYGDFKSFAVMKKHYKAYVNGWDDAKSLRVKLMETKSAAEVRSVVDKYTRLPSRHNLK